MDINYETNVYIQEVFASAPQITFGKLRQDGGFTKVIPNQTLHHQGFLDFSIL
jgi:hypothetical protein